MSEGTPVNDGSQEGIVDPNTGKPASELQAKVDELTKQIEEQNKRIAGQTKSWQEERQRREEIEDKVKKYEKYDFLLDDLGENSPAQPVTPTSPKPNDDSARQLSQMRLQIIETKYAANPANKDKAHIVADSKLRNMVYQEAAARAAKETQEYGNVVSSDEEIFAYGVDEVAKFVDTLKTDGARIVEEERSGIPGNVNLGKGRAPAASSNEGGEEEDGGFIVHSIEEEKSYLSEYVSNRQKAQGQMRGGK